MFWDKWRITGSGNAADGFIVDVHDGVNNAVYRPEVATIEDALSEAESSHASAFHQIAADAALVQVQPAAPLPEVPLMPMAEAPAATEPPPVAEAPTQTDAPLVVEAPPAA
jgi:hypothetical protein